jgi:hypothetical protein
MRIAFVALLAVVAVPPSLEAQFRRPTRRPPPTIPAELPPAAPVVEKALAYKRTRLAIEAYPLVNVIHAPALGSTWSTVGAGSQATYRLTPWVLASLDITTAAWGGPTRSETAELGMRIMTDRFESRTRPYADLRVGYMSTFDPNFHRGSGSLPGLASDGFGGVVGGGFHRDLNDSFSLTTGASVMHGRLSNTGPVVATSSYSFTSYRLTVGLRYNRVRQVQALAQPR